MAVSCYSTRSKQWNNSSKDTSTGFPKNCRQLNAHGRGDHRCYAISLDTSRGLKSERR
jgi:hypothetical protein